VKAIPQGVATSASTAKKLLARLSAVAAAAAADMVVVQDQVNTTNTTEFDYLYSNTRAEAQAANPAVTTDAEVSTGYGTAGQMATAAKSAHAGGIHINATTPTLDKTKSFLHAMQAAGY